MDLGSVFLLSLALGTKHFYDHSPGAVALPNGAFYTIYVYSPEGDNATALVEFVLFECSCC